MDYQLRIPQNHPHRQRLEKAIANLLAFVEAGTIYISNNRDDNLPTIITFILKKNCGQSGDTVLEMSKKIVKWYPDFIFRFINAFRASHGFKRGLPYLIRNCTIDELIYYEPSNKVFFPTNLNPKKLVKKAKLNFSGDKEVALKGFQASLTHINNNQNFEAALEMYMAFWGLFCCYSEFLIGELGEDTKYSNLLEEYERVTGFAPHLKNILDYAVPDDKEIIVLLSTAYFCNDQNIPMAAISWTVLERAKQKFELLDKELERLFKVYTKYCKQKKIEFSNQRFLGKSIFTDKIQSNYIMDLALSEVGTVIADFFRTRAIYCFGYTVIHNQDEVIKTGYFRKKLPRYHFYLLVLNMEHKENAASVLQSHIREKFQDRYKVTILNHRVHYLSKQSQNQKHFFDTITTNGLLIYNNPLYPMYCKIFGVARDLEFSKNYWQNRILAAEHFLILVQDSNEPEVSLIINSVLQQCIKQIAAGLIDLFLGYHPNKYSVSYLFALVQYLDIIELPFDLNNEIERVAYQLLSASSDMILHKNLRSENTEDSDFLFGKCEKFFELAEQIGNNEVERIQNSGID
jgi:hypothetical protein